MNEQAMEYEIEVLQEEVGPPSVYVIYTPRQVDEEILQVVGLMLDGGTVLKESEDTPIALAKMYAGVKEHAQEITVRKTGSRSSLNINRQKAIALIGELAEAIADGRDVNIEL